MKPYKQLKFSNITFRLFYKKEDQNLYYKWHIDEKSRTVWFLPLGNWRFQFNEQLPENINSFKIYHIPTGIYHRLIQKSGYLFCIILEK